MWQHVEPLLKEAVDHCGSWSIGKIRGGVFDGSQLLWITWDGNKIQAAATTRLIREEKGLVCQAIACGGSDADWQERFSAIEEYARDEGCVSSRIQGRPGWSRVFKSYRTEWISLEKRLD